MPETLSVIIGCMFSGKTEELVRQVRRNEIAGIKPQVFKPDIDTRWGKIEKVRSHNGIEYPAVPIPIDTPLVILQNLTPETKLVAIDETQFFNPEIIEVIKRLLLENVRVIIAGLNLDFRGEPFGSMPILTALADQVTKLTAVCTYVRENGEICGKDATRTQRLIDGKPSSYDSPVVLIGGKEAYTARCVEHHFVPGKPEVLFEASMIKK